MPLEYEPDSQSVKGDAKMNETPSKLLPLQVHEKYISQIRQGLPNWTGKAEDLVMMSQPSMFNESFDRTHLIFVQEGQEKGPFLELSVTSISELFRGDIKPGEFEDYKVEYIPFFYNIEAMLVEVFPFFCEKTVLDDNFIDVYSTMRRRPDGKSIGYLHDLIWQETAYFLLLHCCSQWEYESCFQRMERGVRKFHMNFSSHNYYDFIIKNVR